MNFFVFEPQAEIPKRTKIVHSSNIYHSSIATRLYTYKIYIVGHKAFYFEQHIIFRMLKPLNFMKSGSSLSLVNYFPLIISHIQLEFYCSTFRYLHDIILLISLAVLAPIDFKARRYLIQAWNTCNWRLGLEAKIYL